MEKSIYKRKSLGKNYYMAYFNYHAKVQNLIKEGHCLGAEIVEKYNNISPALVLYFDNHRPMPIRQHRFDDYLALLKKYGILVDFKDDIRLIF